MSESVGGCGHGVTVSSAAGNLPHSSYTGYHSYYTRYYSYCDNGNTRYYGVTVTRFIPVIFEEFARTRLGKYTISELK